MIRAEAEAHCAELNRDPDDGGGGRWLVQEAAPGDWRAVRLRVRGLAPTHPLKATVESRPRPEDPPDPRPAIFRNIPPYGAG